MKQVWESALDKSWLMYDRDAGITSVIRFVKKNAEGNYIVAISRSFKSPMDRNFVKEEGRSRAFDTMKKYYKTLNFKKSSGQVPRFEIRNVYEGKPEKARFPNGTTIFVVGEENVMSHIELKNWHNVFLPAIERELVSWK